MLQGNEVGDIPLTFHNRKYKSLQGTNFPKSLSKPLAWEFLADEEYFKGGYIVSCINNSGKKFLIFNQCEKPKGFKKCTSLIKTRYHGGYQSFDD